MVTGAASGFGEAIALRFAAEGASVVVADLDDAGGTARTREWLALFRASFRIAIWSYGDRQVEATWAPLYFAKIAPRRPLLSRQNDGSGPGFGMLSGGADSFGSWGYRTSCGSRSPGELNQRPVI